MLWYDTILNMYQGNLSKDEYGTQRFLADLSFKSVTVEINPNTNNLYYNRSNQYGFSCIQYQRSVIDWLLRENGNAEVRYKTLDIQIREERYTHTAILEIYKPALGKLHVSIMTMPGTHHN